MPRRRAVPPPPVPAPVSVPVAAPAPVQLYSVEDAAKRLAVSLRTLRKQITAGRVRVVRIGHVQRISEAELQRISVDGASAT